MPSSKVVAPYRIETERLVVRSWEPADAPLLKEAVDASLDHLRPWLPWARAEPQPLAEKRELLASFRSDFERGIDAVYAIFDRDGGRVLGGTGLHPRIGLGGREIGYWCRADAEGNGYVTEAVAALTRVAFELLGFERVQVRCDPRNVRSAAVPRRLAFVHQATCPDPGGEGDVMVFSLAADDYLSSPAARAELAAYDVSGGRLL